MQALPQLERNGTARAVRRRAADRAPIPCAALVDAARGGLALLTQSRRARGYGRIVRDGGAVERIVEEKDASANERAIREVNTGILAAKTEQLAAWLARLRNDNAQGEYYLTDVIAAAVADGVPVRLANPPRRTRCLGVNSKVELATSSATTR